MRPEELAAGIDQLLYRSPALPGRLAGALLVANPKAGGFTRPSFARSRHRELGRLMELSDALPARADPPPFALALTEGPGHAAALTSEYLSSTLRGSASKEGLHLLMTAGGDGTSLELASALMGLAPAERERFLVLRLPFGTGNDGADGRDLLASLGRLLGPCRPGPRPAVRCSPASAGGRQTLWAFNIASVGIDAFVALMTNRLKSHLPGDSYKLWVDLSTVLYDFHYRVKPLRVRAWNEGGEELRDFSRACLLLAVGASGNRQYGSNKRILPDQDNVCCISQTGLLNRLASKGRIERGLHRGLPIVELFSAARIELDYDERIPFQADGEVAELEAGDFPFTMAVEPDSYNVLEGEGSWR